MPPVPVPVIVSFSSPAFRLPLLNMPVAVPPFPLFNLSPPMPPVPIPAIVSFPSPAFRLPLLRIPVAAPPSRHSGNPLPMLPVPSADSVFSVSGIQTTTVKDANSLTVEAANDAGSAVATSTTASDLIFSVPCI